MLIVLETSYKWSSGYQLNFSIINIILFHFVFDNWPFPKSITTFDQALYIRIPTKYGICTDMSYALAKGVLNLFLYCLQLQRQWILFCRHNYFSIVIKHFFWSHDYNNLKFEAFLKAWTLGQSWINYLVIFWYEKISYAYLSYFDKIHGRASIFVFCNQRLKVNLDTVNGRFWIWPWFCSRDR